MATPVQSHTFRINEITGAVVNSAMKVHSVLGPGLLESVYQACLAHELRSRGFNVAVEVPLPVVYEGQKLEVGYRIDLVVEGRVVAEVKSVEALHPIHQAQLLLHEAKRNRCGPAVQLQRPPSARRNQAHGRRQRLDAVALCTSVPPVVSVLRFFRQNHGRNTWAMIAPRRQRHLLPRHKDLQKISKKSCICGNFP